MQQSASEGGEPRRHGSRAPQIMYKVFAGQKPPVDRGAMPAGFRDLLESCWENDPAARPSFREILTRLRQLLSEERQRRFALQRAAADAEVRTYPTLTFHPHPPPPLRCTAQAPLVRGAWRLAA
jgi:hypothetical protein